MTTPLYPTFRRRVNEAVDQLIKKQVTPWSFLTAGPPFRIKAFDGRDIAYSNVEFDGSPQQVFWSRYIEPFLEELCISEISAAISAAQEKGADARLLLPELQALLLAGYQRVYTRMADVDWRLIGSGVPEKVARRSTDREMSSMTRFVEERINAELEMWKPKSRVSLWYERNKFWVWAIGTIVSMLGLLGAFLG